MSMKDSNSILVIDRSNIEHMLFSVPLFAIQFFIYFLGLGIMPSTSAGLAWFWTVTFWFGREAVQEADCRRHGLRPTNDTAPLQVAQFWRWQASQNRDWAWPAALVTWLYLMTYLVLE